MLDEIRETLYSLAEDDYRDFNRKLLPDVDNILGVRLPMLRKLAKKIAAGDFRAYLSESASEAGSDSAYEEIMLHGLVIGYVKTDREEYRKFLDEFVPRISNWGVCDSCANSLKFMRKDPEYWFEYLMTYRNSREEFELRFMIVSMMDHFLDEAHRDTIRENCNDIRHEGYYTKRGVAWTLQACYVKFPEKTRALLENSRMDGFTHNKAIQKIRESYRVSKEEKEELKKLTK